MQCKLPSSSIRTGLNNGTITLGHKGEDSEHLDKRATQCDIVFSIAIVSIEAESRLSTNHQKSYFKHYTYQY